MQIVLAHPGTQHSRHLARELENRGLLEAYWTGVAFAEGSLGAAIARIGSKLPGLHGLNSRVLPGIRARRLHIAPYCELKALWQLRRGGDSQVILHERNAAFQQAISDDALPTAGGALIGFDTSSWLLAERCARRSIPFYLDRTTAHPAALQRIMMDFGRRFPDWAQTRKPRLPVVAAAEKVEHELARKIVVGGCFARNTLLAEGIPGDRICVNAYGVDWLQFMAERSDPVASHRPFRFLYVGSVNAQKGIPVLLDAWRILALRDAELWIAGHIGEHERRLIPAMRGLRLLGQVSHHMLPAIYASCDLFVMPSLFEGFGLVILEALAAGLPVITTPNTGAADALADPVLGTLVPAGSVDALVEAMRSYPSALPSRALFGTAVEKLRTHYSWTAYGDRWATLLSEEN